MGGKHLKRLRAEKSKVKLKGAKLPKGLNVTKTDFKVKKIVLQEQLKEHVAPGTHKQLNIKETQVRLKHTRDSMRLDALQAIRENAEYVVSVAGAVPQLVPNVAACSLHLERKVRAEAVKTLGKLLSLLRPGAASPNFNMLSSYVRCAMTHIKREIQEDALLLLDALLKYTPEIFELDNEKIFKSFLEMISFARAGGDETKRALSANIGQRQTTIAWRTKVLQRVQQLIAILACKQSKTQQARQACERAPIEYHKPGELNYKPLRRRNIDEPLSYADVCNSRVFADVDEADQASAVQENAGQSLVRSYAQHLMPLLFDTWLEVRPSMSFEKSTSTENEEHLTGESADTLKVILEIIAHLWTLVEQHDAAEQQTLRNYMQVEYAEKFRANFYEQSFPYKKTTMLDDGCIQHNVRLIYLLCRYFPSPKVKDREMFGNLLSYLLELLTDIQQHNLSSELQGQLVDTLRICLLTNARPLLKLHPELLRKLMHAFAAAFMTKAFQAQHGVAKQAITLLCAIFDDASLYSAYESRTQYDALFAYLPSLLLKPTIHESTVAAMLNLCRRLNESFMNALESSIIPVVENLQALRVIGALNALEGKRPIMAMFCYTRKSWNKEKIYAALEKHVTDPRINETFKSFLTINK